MLKGRLLGEPSTGNDGFDFCFIWNLAGSLCPGRLWKLGWMDGGIRHLSPRRRGRRVESGSWWRRVGWRFLFLVVL